MNFYRILLRLWAATLRHYAETLSRLFRIEAATLYVKFAADLRAVAIGACLAGLGLFVFACGFLLLHVGFFLWLPWCLETKAILMCGLGAVYLLVTGVSVAALLSERRWMRLFKADTMVASALAKK